jgi:hypothetical protein
MSRNYPPYTKSYKETFDTVSGKTIEYTAYSEQDETGWEIGVKNVKVINSYTGSVLPTTSSDINVAEAHHQQTWDKDGHDS